MTYIPNRAAKITWATVRRIRHLYEEEGWTQGRLSREFGIGTAQVGRIVRYESWQEQPHDLPEEATAEGSVVLLQKLLGEAQDQRDTERKVKEDLNELLEEKS